MGIVYMLGDAELENVTKIGYTNDWEYRYGTMQSYNPRGISVYCICIYPPDVSARSKETKCKGVLSEYKRREADGGEWFDLSPEEAFNKVSKGGFLDGKIIFNQTPKIKNSELPHDDWRSMKKKYDLYKRLLWVFQEDSPEKRIKVIHSPLYNSCYTNVFTFNPYKVYLVSAYHHNLMTTSPSSRLQHGNDLVEKTWVRIVKNKDYGPGLFSKKVGWLKPNASLQSVHDEAICSGLTPYDLATPKPNCMCPKDGWENQVIGYGETPPLGRVRIWEPKCDCVI